MDRSNSLKDSIINVGAADFEHLALNVFNYQALHNDVYRRYIEILGRNPSSITQVKDIPFLPVSFFKDHVVTCDQPHVEQIFYSSGTTGMSRSAHHVHDVAWYIKVAEKGFRHTYGKLEDLVVLALLPSYLENPNSSLIYMVDAFIRISKDPLSGYVNSIEDILERKKAADARNKTCLLIGVTYALLDMAEQSQPDLSGMIIMETGGMKGRKKELVREELHTILKQAFKVPAIHAEYGMTELLSQAYALADGRFTCPPWMRILIREINDPFEYVPLGKTGAINIIDLANIDSCAFLEIQDIGRMIDKDHFEVLGRMDNSEIRGCSLLYV